MKKISILVLLASLLLVFSCRTENLLETESSNVNNQISKIQLTSKKISLNEAKHKEKLLSGIKDAEISLKAMAKGINNNGVYIDIDNLIYIENGPDYHTYTFNIIREGTGDDTPLENLVLSPLTDGTYREVLVTYNLSSKEKDILREGGMVDFSKKMTFTPLQNNIFSKYTSGGQDCHMEIDSYYTKCSENVHDHGEQYPTCTAGKPSEIVYVIKEVCIPNNGGGESPYNPIDPYNPPGNDGGNGNNEGGDEYGGSSPCNGTGVLTGPQAPVSDPGFDQGGGCTGIPTQPNTALSFSSIIINLPAELKNTLDDNPDFKNGLETYYNINHKSVKAKNFVLWGTIFKWDNPSTTWKQFNNWFMTKSEGQDGEYISSLDNILNSAQYQTKQMPTYSQFVSAFPKVDYPGYPGYYLKMPASQVYPIIGGYLESLYNDKKDNGPFRNACAARWSLGMNGAGILIPQNNISISGANINGQPRYYIVNSTAAGDFMQKTFGNPTHKLQGADANNATKIANFLNGKTGIYVVVNNSYEEAGYYGHIDLIQNGHIPGGANVQNVPGGIKSIRIWEFTP